MEILILTLAEIFGSFSTGKMKTLDISFPSHRLARDERERTLSGAQKNENNFSHSVFRMFEAFFFSSLLSSLVFASPFSRIFLSSTRVSPLEKKSSWTGVRRKFLDFSCFPCSIEWQSIYAQSWAQIDGRVEHKWLHNLNELYIFHKFSTVSFDVCSDVKEMWNRKDREMVAIWQTWTSRDEKYVGENFYHFPEILARFDARVDNASNIKEGKKAQKKGEKLEAIF